MISVVIPNLNDIASRVENVGKTLPEYIDQSLERVVARARDTAKAFYGGAGEDFDVPLVTYDKIGDGEFVVTATGKQVMFLEFGAGDKADAGHGYASEVPFAVFPGSWSQTHSRMYANLGYWISPEGKYYKYITPTRAMFIAAQEAKQSIQSGEWLRDEATGL